MLLARLTADWMWRKRQRLTCRRRVRRLRAIALRLPLKIFLTSFREFDLQTISGLALCPPYFGTEALGVVGELRRALGVGDGAARERRESAQQNQQRPYPPHPNGNVHHVGNALESLAMLPRLVGLLVVLLLLPASASAAPRVEHLKFKYGPVTIKPGQNTIALDGDGVPRPKRPGWIVGFRPNLERADGTIPRVDVLHLHHAVWLINGSPTFAAGEEKTNVRLPKGFGWRHEPSDQWVLNHMIHNLLPNRDRVYLTYTLDFIPDTSPAAKGIRPVETRWLDVEGGKAYPVFDVHRGSGRSGRNGRFTYPDDVPNAYGGGVPAQPGDDRARRRARGDRWPPPPGRPVHRPQAHT